MLRLTCLVLLGAVLAGCGSDSREACFAVALGTPASELPLGGTSTWTGYTGGEKGPAYTFACCHRSVDPGAACGVDCSLPEWRGTPVELAGADYTGRCYEEGGGHCTVWLVEDRVAAVQFYCQD